MTRETLDVAIEIAGGLIWLAPRSLGGLSPRAFSECWMGGGGESLESLMRRGVIMPLGLYQDDGFIVRFVHGDLTVEEEAEWTARAAMNLDIPCGELLVSGVLTPDFENLEYPAMEVAEPDTSAQLGCYINVSPGRHRIDLYSYPPGDLSSGWGHIVNTDTFGSIESLEGEESRAYFERTRPGEQPPAWIDYGDDELRYVNFIVRITPFDASLPPPKLGEDGVGLPWTFRKPEKFPLGIPSTLGVS